MTVPIAAWAATASLTCAMPRAVIAIPAYNEVARLPDCLAALASQRLPGGLSDTTVLVLANNCSDATAIHARALAPGLPFPLLVLERWLPSALAHAGGARRAAMDAAAALAGPATALLCTDADARPEPGWLAANLAALAAGADAVAGAIDFDAAEVTSLPPGLRRREALEGCYALRLAALAARVDPLAHDPWPVHGTHSGASIALRLAAYQDVGGVPAIPVGEDRALFAALARRDARIRHTPEARVIVSCRLDGRASGGMAETMRRRSNNPREPLDDRLEAVIPAVIRLRSRAALRRLRLGRPRVGDPVRLALALGVKPGLLREIVAAPSFGLAWEALQAEAPRLRRKPLSLAALPGEIARAEVLLRLFSPARPAVAAARPADTALLAPAG